jgi:DNA-binding CsgD family transcriptional regulator
MQPGNLTVLDLDNFSQAVARIYDASMDVERWTDTLSLVAQIFASRNAQISAGSPDAIAFVKFWGWTDEQLADFVPRYVALTPTDPRMGMGATRFKATHCRQFVSDHELWASELYRQALKPAGVEYAMGIAVTLEREMGCMLSVMRGPDQVAFTNSDCADFGRLSPHIARAANMHGAFQQCREQLAAVNALLDSVPVGMMVVDDDELKVANRAAQELLGDGDAMRVQNGRLYGATRRGNADLRDAVQQALSDTDQPIGLALPIEHDEPVRAVVRRLHPASAGMLGAPSEAVALYVTDPRKPIETSEEILQRLFGLTTREASVLRVLVEGEDLQGVAARLGIGIATVRGHIKHIMETTGARRQAELVGMVLSSPAWIAAPSVWHGSRAPTSRRRRSTIERA